MPDFDLFLVPFLTGLVFAAILPVLGAYLRLRNEWLAALSYAHVAAAGALLASWAGLPPTAGGLAVAGLAGMSQRLFASRLSGDAGYALLLLAGWAATILVTANQPMAERLGHALFDGQLYFSGGGELIIAVLSAGGVSLVLQFLSSRLLLARLYPDFFRSRGIPRWPVDLGFNLLSALALALATMSLGVMAVFALMFVPAWLAFRRAPSWRHGLFSAALIGVVGYLVAFALALWLDQPFGAVLAFLLVFPGILVA